MGLWRLLGLKFWLLKSELWFVKTKKFDGNNFGLGKDVGKGFIRGFRRLEQVHEATYGDRFRFGGVFGFCSMMEE